MTIRRSRFYDFYKVWGNEGVDFVWSMRGLDYIRVLITGWYAMGAGLEWRTNMQWLTLSEIPIWDKATTFINNKLKSTQAEEGWRLYAEMKCLSGYRLLPWPGYDEIKDTEALAKGGIKKDMMGGFKYWAKLALTENSSIETVYQTFDEYIKSGVWITGGASSEGKIEVEYKGEVFTVKCRKNMVVDALTSDEIVINCLKRHNQVSTAFIKNELGKLRVAVCSDLETYLKMSYIVSMSGRGYKYWKSVTRQENVKTKILRMLRTVNNCKLGLYGMAWDYEGFDRQVETAELIDIFGVIINAANANIPESVFTEWNRLVEDVVKSFEDSIIIGTDGEEYDVTGGLPSGLYLTSICGDGFNKTFCEYVRNILRKLGLPEILDELIDVQGDDTNILNTSVAILQMFDWLLQRSGVVGGNGKFGITKSSTEFLRVSFNENGAHGYPARSVAGIVQRKPWSDTPAKETDIIEAMIEATNTSVRRGLKLGNSEDILLRIWCRKNKISYIVARTPINLGGLGLSKPIQNVRVTGMPKFDTPAVKVARRTDWRENDWIAKGAELGIGVPIEVAKQLADADAAKIVVGDEVKGITKAIRNTWKEAISKAKIKTVKYQPLSIRPHNVMIEQDVNNMGKGEGYTVEKSYGIWKKIDNQLTTIDTLSTYKLVKKNEWLKENRPEYLNDVNRLGARIGFREAELWLLGKMPTYIENYNPIVTSQIEAVTTKNIDISKVPRNRLNDIWISSNRYTLEAMRLNNDVQELYNW